MSDSSNEHVAANRAENSIKQRAFRFMPDAQLILFGSRARGDAYVRSDFDLAFKPKPGFRNTQILQVKQSGFNIHFIHTLS